MSRSALLPGFPGIGRGSQRRGGPSKDSRLIRDKLRRSFFFQLAHEPRSHHQGRHGPNRNPMIRLARQVLSQQRPNTAGVKYTQTPNLRAALARVLPGFGVRRVRNVQNVYVGKPLGSPTFWLNFQWRRRLMELFDTTEHFYMPTSAGDRGWSGQVLAQMTNGTLEVAGHPGFHEAWRAHEREDLCRFAKQAQESGHELIGWRDL